jgi:hypothetical protein
MITLDNLTVEDIKRIFPPNYELATDRRTREIIYGSAYNVEKTNQYERGRRDGH